MKRITKALALCALMSISATSCQKELITPTQINSDSEKSLFAIHYIVNGEMFYKTFAGEEELISFMRSLMALTREGNTVVVSNGYKNDTGIHSKETVTYTTRSEDDAIAWSLVMIKKGYAVNISEKDGIYTCTAIK